MKLDDPKGQHSLHTGLAGRRNWERLEYQTRMELAFPDGRSLTAETADVSLGGAFLVAPDLAFTTRVGEAAELRTTENQDTFRFPCKVVRKTPLGIGVAFNDQQAAFGTFATHEMMLELMANTTAAFASSLDVDATLESTVSHIKNYMQAEAASLFLVEDDGKSLVCRACAGPVDITGVRLAAGEGVAGHTIHTGEALIVDDVQNNSLFSSRIDEETGFQTESLLCAPMRIRDQTIGALEVINKRGGGRFVPQDRIVLGALASSAATAIHNARQTAGLIERDIAEKAGLVKTDFFATMSHELRTPLNAILGFAQILDHDREDSLSVRQREAVRFIIKGGERLLGMINEILDLAQIESGQRRLSNSVIDAEDAVAESLALLCPFAENKDVTITDEVIGRRLPLISADASALHQVLMILLTNAITYNRPGGTVTISASVEDDGMIRIAVADTGRGIPDDMRNQIFVPFARHSSEGDQATGTGIGLAIAMKLMGMMSGRIGFESRHGEGSRFWVDLPQAETV